jgi:hypothetical protein
VHDRPHNPTTHGHPGQPSTIVILDRLGASPRRVSRDPGHSFATLTSYASCPRCGAFASIIVEDGIHWRGVGCSCWNPRKRYDDIDLLLMARAS